MGTTLRVDPNRLREAARAQRDVGSLASGLQTGQLMANAGAGMSGLLSAEACQVAGTVFDSAARAVHDELTEHAANLTAAADQYHRTDEGFSRRLHTLAP